MAFVVRAITFLLDTGACPAFRVLGVHVTGVHVCKLKTCATDSVSQESSCNAGMITQGGGGIHFAEQPSPPVKLHIWGSLML
jgi:hypothetical protein